MFGYIYPADQMRLFVNPIIGIMPTIFIYLNISLHSNLAFIYFCILCLLTFSIFLDFASFCQHYVFRNFVLGLAVFIRHKYNAI